jgi:predicted esterase
MQKAVVIFILFTSLLARGQRTAERTVGVTGEKIGFYQYLPPGYHSDPNKKYPVIIFLHGIGEKGTGSEADLGKINCCGIPKYIDAGHDMQFSWNGKKEGFIVVCPQLASRYGTWQNYYIDAMLEYSKKHLRIDTNRVFLTGLSLGGGASWVYASASVSNAKKFAGIAPIVSPCFMSNGCNIANANLPVITVHAKDDDLASPDCTVNSIRSINDCGAVVHPNLILYDNGGHYVWKKRAYDTAYNYFNPNIYEWMLAQNRLLKPNKKPVAKAGKDITISSASGNAIMDGSASSDPDGKVVRYVWQKVSGPSYGIMSHDVTATPQLTGLTYPGVYTFQLRVVDDRAEWSTDSIKITVVDGHVLN